MFLLRTTTKHSETFALVADYIRARELAREHVGDHHPVDGCSTRRYEWENGRECNFRAWRETSFGQRRAEVQAIEVVA